MRHVYQAEPTLASAADDAIVNRRRRR